METESVISLKLWAEVKLDLVNTKHSLVHIYTGCGIGGISSFDIKLSNISTIQFSLFENISSEYSEVDLNEECS